MTLQLSENKGNSKKMTYTCSYRNHLIYLYMTKNNFFPTNLQWSIAIQIDFKSFSAKA